MSGDAFLARRDFLKAAGTAAVGALFWPDRLLAAVADGAGVRWDRVLLLVELKGGNDGLNTLVPFADRRYREARPKLAIPRDDVLQLSETHGLHPSLKPMMAIWEARQLAIVPGVGYAHPNRSHFRSIDIWDTASEADAYLSDGWIARLFGQTRPPEGTAADAVAVGRAGLGPVAGPDARALTLDDPQAFLANARRVRKADGQKDNKALAHLLSVQDDILSAAAVMEEKLKKTAPLKTEFPKHRFGKDLATCARILAAGVPVPVLKVGLTGFDTHQNQMGTHERLLRELAEGLSCFRTACTEAKLWDRVLVMTYSEFGRRVAENGSAGTDHGTAAPHFLLGGKVKGGFHGEHPPLDDLDSGDLKFTTDFRRLYATAARSWWNLPAEGLGKFKPVDCIA